MRMTESRCNASSTLTNIRGFSSNMNTERLLWMDKVLTIRKGSWSTMNGIKPYLLCFLGIIHTWFGLLLSAFLKPVRQYHAWAFNKAIRQRTTRAKLRGNPSLPLIPSIAKGDLSSGYVVSHGNQTRRGNIIFSFCPYQEIGSYCCLLTKSP